jgi:hypothetical protein
MVGGGGSYAPPGTAISMSEDGSRIFFNSSDQLSPEDINSRVVAGTTTNPRRDLDAYEWENGQVSLISGGVATTQAALDGTNPSGKDVFFTSAEGLVPQDTDGSDFDIYDARVDGGFPSPQPSSSSTPCAGSGCRGPLAPPPTFATPGSLLLQGAGNLTPPSESKPKTTAKPKKHTTKKKKKKKKPRKTKRATGKAKAPTKHTSPAKHAKPKSAGKGKTAAAGGRHTQGAERHA